MEKWIFLEDLITTIFYRIFFIKNWAGKKMEIQLFLYGNIFILKPNITFDMQHWENSTTTSLVSWRLNMKEYFYLFTVFILKQCSRFFLKKIKSEIFLAVAYISTSQAKDFQIKSSLDFLESIQPINWFVSNNLLNSM